MSKTYGTLSPDGKYIVAGDEGGGAYVWATEPGKLLWDLYDLKFGKYIKIGSKIEDAKWDDTGLIKQPYDFMNTGMFSVKFIDEQGHYLRFTTGMQYAILYYINDPKPQKYIYLGKDPSPSVYSYDRNSSIDAAPAAGILVTGKNADLNFFSGGILVYKFDPQKQTLTKIWDGG